MQQHSLFGHLATRFSAHPENLATESLHFILQESTVARAAFLRYVRQLGVQLDEGIWIQTQSGEHRNARPDLVGRDASGQPVLVVEAKFWAGLTEQQPISYLKSLPQDRDGILLFLAPEKRFAMLWPELLRRCGDDGMELIPEAPGATAWRTARLNGHRIMAVASWRSLLAYLRLAAESEHQLATASDIGQLQGLCDYMDETAFLPLQSEETTGNTGTRISQYCQLVDDVTNRLVGEAIVSVKGLRATGGRGTYSRYMHLHDFGCWLSFDATLWSAYRPTPLWFSLKDPDWKPATRARERLARLEMEIPPRLVVIDDHVSIPLYLPVAVERDKVLEALAAQIKEIARLLT